MKIKTYNKIKYSIIINIILLICSISFTFLFFLTLFSTKLNWNNKTAAMVFFGILGLFFIIATTYYFKDRKNDSFQETIITCDKFEVIDEKNN